MTASTAVRESERIVILHVVRSARRPRGESDSHRQLEQKADEILLPDSVAEEKKKKKNI